jgi:diaminohydroxyphosphoribosylaminopyrimidine deaminase/5-amino-6-(5-phosphoribosylamino)uracil reductase
MSKPSPAADKTEPDELSARAWRLILAAAVAARRGTSLVHADSSWLEWGKHGCGAAPNAPAPARVLLDLYAPLCGAGPARPLALAQLGQSLDGHIATASGDSYFVTGPDSLRHLHRLRALCAAVVVGAGTVARDDPRLTVRHVEGESPVRVVLDPNARLDPGHRVFTDASVRTIVVHAADVRVPAPGLAEVLQVPVERSRLRLDVLLRELHARGLWSVLVEGGGATVSSFLEAGLLDRLQIAIAPLITGDGRPGLSLAARDKIAECLRPQHRVFALGGDVLFDCDLRAAAPPAVATGALARVF